MVGFSKKQVAYKIVHFAKKFPFQELDLNKTLGRTQDPRANGAWLSKLTE